MGRERGLDDLVDFVLSEVALCGVEGAGSADFRRFVYGFYDGGDVSGLGGRFEEKVWGWVTTHPDIRIVHGGKVCGCSLEEFEREEKGGQDAGVVKQDERHKGEMTVGKVKPAESLMALREALRQRLSSERLNTLPSTTPPQSLEQQRDVSVQRWSRRSPDSNHITAAVFDEPSSTVVAPRLFASQNRIWQALTGHSIDLKKVPTMEFQLLSLIASRGESGITQPELTHLSGQDKRSVPHRTDELARKGYISKNPVQAGKARTSLCVHTKFISQTHFTSSGAVEDVFREGTFVASSFIQLLYNKLKDDGVVPTRDIRKRLGVPMRTWNKRAVQGTLIRLDQTGMISRFRVRRKKAEDSWVTCIQVKREPRPEDLDNLGFRRQTAIADAPEELLQEDGEGDTLMRDIEVDMLDDGDDDENDNALDDDTRIPPQWTPDRLLVNVIYNTIASGGAMGWDGTSLRDRIVGPFWRRPMESHLTRLTDDWERLQPPHLRHLAIIRDTRNTEEKKFLHYVYRTHGDFQQAVDAGVAAWEGVRRTVTNKQARKTANDEFKLDSWGFPRTSQKSFLRFNGTATLTDSCAAIVNKRKYGPRWDIAIAEEIGYQRLETPIKKGPQKQSYRASLAKVHEDDEEKTIQPRKQPAAKAQKKGSGLTLTPEQRTALGLKTTGRLTKAAARQILAHRRETGDATSLPDRIVAEKQRGGRMPLMTAEERIAENLPLKGRLGLDKENEIREQRGLPKLTEKERRKKPTKKDTPILTKQQRINLGFKDHGRLHQHFMDALRKEQEDGIPLEQSPAVEAYREFLKGAAEKTAARKDRTAAATLDASARDHTSPSPSVIEDEAPQEASSHEDSIARPPSPNSGAGKRKEHTADVLELSSKRQRTHSVASQDNRDVLPHQPRRPSVNVQATEVLLPETLVKEHSEDGVDSLARKQRRSRVPKEVSQPTDTMQILDQTTASDLALAVDGASDAVTTPLSPGLHIYPFAKRKHSRGRPRNAYIAVFKYARFHELPWFGSESNTGNGADQTIVWGTPKEKPSQDNAWSGQTLETTQTEDAPQGAMAVDTGSDTLAVSESQAQEQADLQADAEMDIGEDAQPAPISEEACEDSVKLQHTAKPHQQPTEPDPIVIDTDTQQEPAIPLLRQSPMPQSTSRESTPRPVAGWNVINTTTATQPTKVPYQSPYAASTAATPSSSRDQTPALEGNSSALPEGVVGAIAERSDTVKPKKAGSRSLGPGIIGSALKFRREIIMEIIDMCGGVFPLHGEIWRPFSAIWDRKHGHTSMPKPGNSTVFDTLRNMISNPTYQLKRMAFLVKAQNAAGAKERVIVTKANIPPNDPRVVRLAYNMANHALDKSHQYYPTEIRDLFDFETLYVPAPVAPKIESVSLDQIYPELELSIKESRDRRRKEKAAQKKLEKEAAKKQNEQVEKTTTRRRPQPQNIPRAKRSRLASLNDKDKRYRRVPVQAPTLDPALEEAEGQSREAEVREPSPAASDSSGDVPLMSLQPCARDITDRDADDEVLPSDFEGEGNELLDNSETMVLDVHTATILQSAVRFHSPTGTFSTFFGLTPFAAKPASRGIKDTSADSKSAPKAKKRVRIDDPAPERPDKKARSSNLDQGEILDDEFVYSSVEESDTTSSEDEEDVLQSKPKSKPKKRKAMYKRQRGKMLPPPTFLEKLTGLTGDPSDPIYLDPKQRDRSGYTKPWAIRKMRQLNRVRKEREYAENLDHTDKFKKLCFTLALAFLMSGDDAHPSWTIVEKVYTRDKFFDLSTVKRLWSWMQTHRAAQLATIVDTLQTNILAAYEAGRLPMIEDPEAYDWGGLVRWTMRTCTYPELTLPVLRESLKQFIVDESEFASLDRVNWYAQKLADSARTQLQLQLSFAVPLHQKPVQDGPAKKKEIKARSWIRSNIATLQPYYDANKAHDKLRMLGEDILTRVVGHYVLNEHLKARKLRRQLPGRNYTFTKKFAKKYKRPFELEDFMSAAMTKKELDSAFSAEGSAKRFYSISSCEEDGSIMAIMSLIGDGRVKLVPQLPPVNNEFGAPLPRLSKWGFCEGDYIHRAIDRSRSFWDMHVVPTSSYQYGNPLCPSASPAADWSLLPEPPLPGKHDTDALLPIWSSIDGQSITWPWWNRILNLVLQPLFIQPGATAIDIYRHCPENVVEVFEIELVLDWLHSVGAVSTLVGGGYQTTPSFWAAFGDRLLGAEEDWFGEHVKRRSKRTVRHQWRDKYNLQYSTMQARGARTVDDGGDMGQSQNQTSGPGNAVSSRIFQNSNAQYRIVQQALSEPAPPGADEQGTEEAVQNQDHVISSENIVNDAVAASTGQEKTPETTKTQDQDVEMVDANADTHVNGDDVDAEGEIDDAML